MDPACFWRTIQGDHFILLTGDFRLIITRNKLFYVLILALALPAYSFSEEVDKASILRQRLEYLQSNPVSKLNGKSLAAVPFLLELYSRRNFRPTWNNNVHIEEFISIIEATVEEGLKPNDYHAVTLRNMQQQVGTGNSRQDQVDFDILLTDALFRLGTHLRFGKVDPARLDSNWNVGREIKTDDPVAVFQDAIDSDSLKTFINDRIPRQAFYLRFKQALKQYRAIRDAGGWPVIPDGPVLKPGMTDPRVAIMSERLSAEGDFVTDVNSSSHLYGDELEQAVIRFQQRHGLEADGVAGQKTFTAMNISVENRISQIKANLERSRWVFTDLTGDFLVVNIAGYKLYLVKNDDLVWTTNVMVGKTYRKTPVFKSKMKYLVWNPTWTVPPGILRKDIIPKMKKDPDYLNKKGYLLLDRDGNEVNQATVDFSSLSSRNFPYIVRQPAGPNNALGQVKFIFPNGHFVFLHDTNHRELFIHSKRAFSSGCIRVEDPLKLAELVLENPEQWDNDGIQKVLSSGKTRTVHLAEPLPVLLLYWTTVVAPDGSVSFYEDVYGRDQRIIESLDQPFELSADAKRLVVSSIYSSSQ